MANDYSITTGVKRGFGIWDYVVFALLFVSSAVIGFYHAYKDRKSNDVRQFHLGGRKMHPLPVSLSLAATFMSALTLLGTPAEVYTNGTMFMWIIFGMFVSTVVSAHVTLPIFYQMNTTSCFEYLQRRFGTPTRIAASIVFQLQTLLYMGFVLYAPSLAFQAVTGLSLWGSMIAVASVSTLYTTLGGMKTVLWTDSLQFTVMSVGLVSLLIGGSIATGGFGTAWEIARTHGRIEFTNISPHPHTRHTVWSLGIGGSFFWTYLYGVNQSQVQRSCTLPNLKRAQLAVWMNFPFLAVINILTCLIGVVMFAFYVECDPVKFGLVDKNDQIVPLMVLDVLGTVPTLSGIFMACVFSGGLSSISSGLNAMSAVILEDYIKCFCFKSLSGKKELMLSKAFVILFGCVMFGIAVLISTVGGMVIQLSYTLTSIMYGPLLGCFLAGMLFPWTNNYGAFSGLLVSLAIMCWLGFGSQLDPPPATDPLPVYTTSCPFNGTQYLNSTDFITMTTTIAVNSTSTAPLIVDNNEENLMWNFYKLSYQWYACFGTLITLCTSLIVSAITGLTDPKSVDSSLMFPLFYKLCPCLPERWRKYLKFGVIYDDNVEEKRTKLKDYELNPINTVNETDDKDEL